MAKYCSSCGKALVGSEKFCSSCGNPIKYEDSNPVMEPKMSIETSESINPSLDALKKTEPVEKAKGNAETISTSQNDATLKVWSKPNPVGSDKYPKTKTKQNKSEYPKTKSKFAGKLGKGIRYFFGAVMILGGLVSISTDFSRIFAVLFGISLLPIIYDLARKRLGNDERNNKTIRIAAIASPILFALLMGVFPPSDPIVSIEIQNSAPSVAIGETTTITLVTDPVDFDLEKLKWESSNENIATVVNGVITGVSEGDVTITVTGSKEVKDSILVHIKFVDITNLTLQGPSSVVVGKTGQLSVGYAPTNATEKKVTWSSSDPTVISIDQNGVMSALTKGSAIITAESENGITASVTVSSFYEVASINLSSSSLTIEKLKTASLIATILPAEASDNVLTWSSSDASVATVENGVITALKVGSTTITVSSVNGVSATCTITVTEVLAESIKLNYSNYELKVGNTLALKATLTPTNTTDKTIVWTTSDSSVITVVNGVVTAKSYGSATITATSSNGKEASCEFLVKQLSPITMLNWRYTSDMFGGVEWTFKLKNNTNKKINYITLQWYNFNSVGDFVHDYIDDKTYTRLRFTGPLAAYATTGTQSNTTLFYSYSYDNSILSEIIVEYADGTSQTIDLYNIDYFYDTVKY